MLGYLKVRNLCETDAVPVSVSPFLDYYEGPRKDYVYLAGTFANDATESGEQLPLQTSKITCIQQTHTCRIATATITDHQVSLDDDKFDDVDWTDRYISFQDSTPICYNQYYSIDRVAKSFDLVSKKKKEVADKVCMSMPDEPRRISLKRGFDVYWSMVQAYKDRTAGYFNLLLLLLNGAYALLILRFLRGPALARRRQSPIQS